MENNDYSYIESLFPNSKPYLRTAYHNRIKNTLLSYGYRIASIKKLVNQGAHIFAVNGNVKSDMSIVSLLTLLNILGKGTVHVVGALEDIQTENSNILQPNEVNPVNEYHEQFLQAPPFAGDDHAHRTWFLLINKKKGDKK